MHVLMPTYGSRRYCDAVAAAAEECDAPVATGVTPTGVWR